MIPRHDLLVNDCLQNHAQHTIVPFLLHFSRFFYTESVKCTLSQTKTINQQLFASFKIYAVQCQGSYTPGSNSLDEQFGCFQNLLKSMRLFTPAANVRGTKKQRLVFRSSVKMSAGEKANS